MVSDLDNYFIDPFEQQNACISYNKLAMTKDQRFQEFYIEFTCLVGIAKIHPSNLLDDLYYKVTMEMQNKLLPALQTFTTVKKLANQCQLIDQHLHRMKTERLQQKGLEQPKPQSTFGRMNKGLPADQKKFTPLQAPAPFPFRPTTKPANTPKHGEFKCFNCDKTDHLVKDCPAPKRPGIYDLGQPTEETDGSASSDDDTTSEHPENE
jgi:hypothetical protein